MRDKQQIRKAALAGRKELSEVEYQNRNESILDHFSRWPVAVSLKAFHCFLPIAKNKEPDTWPIIDFLQRNDKAVIISRSDTTTNVLTHFHFEDRSQLRENKWGIPEPVTGELADVSQLDMVFIPLLAFDLAGNRIGYGKGYYDRFLSACKEDVLKVGLSLLPPLAEPLEAEAHDIPLDYCITHEQIYKFDRDNLS